MKENPTVEQFSSIGVMAPLDGDMDSTCSQLACQLASSSYVSSMNWLPTSIREAAKEWRTKVESRATPADASAKA